MLTLLCLVPFTADAKSRLENVAGNNCRITWATDYHTPIEGYDIVIGNPSQEMIQSSTDHLRWVQLVSSGTDRYTTGFPDSVTLTCATGVFGKSISQHVLAMLLSLYSHFPSYTKLQSKCKWQPDYHGESLYDSNVLILGAGNIGTSVANLLKPFSCHITGIKRNTDQIPEGFDAVYSLDDLDTLLPQMDIIICSLPATSETKCLLNRERIRMIKHGATLINVGRGNLIDHDALADALASGSLFGAGLDVTDPEPLPSDHRLWCLENVIITPHVSGPSFTKEGCICREITDLCEENLRRYLSGEQMKNLVDIKLGYAAK